MNRISDKTLSQTVDAFNSIIDNASNIALAQMEASLRPARSIRLGNEHAKHGYDIGCRDTSSPEAYATKITIRVNANNRTQAAAIAEKAGYEVADVNMIG